MKEFEFPHRGCPEPTLTEHPKNDAHGTTDRCIVHGSGRPKSAGTTNIAVSAGVNLQSGRRAPPPLFCVAPPIVVHFNNVKLLPLMYAKNYQNWLRRFKDKSNNVRWPRFLGPR